MNQLQFSFIKSVRGSARWMVAVLCLTTLFVLLDTTAAHAQNITRTWYLDNVRFDSGAVATGSFDYNTNPYNPFAGQYGTYSNININVTSPDGTVREFRIVNPDSEGNERYLSIVAATGGDLTGAPFLALTPAISMTNAGGVIDILPGPQDLSYLGVCRSSNCGFAEEPYEEALPGGQIVAGPRKWHIDNVRFDSGAVATGSFVYDEYPYNPFAGQYGTYSNININVTSPDGTVREFRIVNPDSEGNERYLSMVAATGGDLTGAPFLALTPAISMTNAAGPINILPGPQDLSYLGVCRSVNCGFAEEPYEEALAGGRIVREVAPPTIVSNSSVNVIENQTNAIDVESTDNLDMEGNGLVYTISGGAEQALFDIDADTGVVTFINAPDFEAPADAGADNVYNLQVTVTDLGGRTAVQDISITVTDEIEDTTPPTANPTFDPAPSAAGWYNADVTITWNWTDEAGGSGIDPNNCELTSTLAGEGALAIVGQCSDLAGNLGLQGSGSVNIDKSAPVANSTFDPAPNAAGWYNADVTITWNWTDPAAANGATLSGIDPNNCELTSTLVGEGPLAIVGQCPDLAGNLGLQGSGSVNIDQTAPETTITANPPATSTTDDATLEFTGTDALSGVAGFTCTLDDGIAAASGPCTSPQNYTALANGTYTFTIQAIDVAGNVDPTPASYTWIVDIPPANVAPTITSANSASAAENQTGSIDVQATDDTDAEGSGLTFSLSGGADQALFSIDANTGVVTFNNAPDFEAPTDANTDNVYEIQVTVTDLGGLTALQEITITAVDVAEQDIDVTPTSFDFGQVEVNTTSAPQNFTITNQGTENLGLIDAVATRGNEIGFAGGSDCLFGGQLAPAASCTLNVTFTPASTGNKNLTLDIITNDPDEGNFRIALTGIGNLAPTITSANSTSIAENQTGAIDVNATDNIDSEGSGLTFSLTGGADQALFSINANTGVVTFISAPDFENPSDADGDNAYDIQVTVTDSGELTDVQDITISVMDVSETLVCEPGSYLANPSDTSCTLADPGFFVPVAGATEQTPCAAGTFSDLAGAINCTEAAPGFFVPAEGASEARPCPLGSYSSESGAIACTLAEIGYYVDSEGSASPTQCPVGTTTASEGSTDINACVPVTPTNEAPVVDAGSAQTITLPASAELNGTVTDDGLPGPFAVQWSKVSGLGDVIFDDGAAQATTASFSAAGTYVLRLTANDGELSGTGDVMIMVNDSDVIAFATCGGYDVMEVSPGVYEAPSFAGNLIVDTNGGNWINGTNGPDLILGLGGPDDIFGKKGDDVICGGKGKDYIEGNRGNDVLFGDEGADWLIGGNGNDILWGGKGPDDLEGNNGQDTLHGEDGYDILLGGNGSDELSGGNGPDDLYGNRGADNLNGGNGNDYCQGGPGKDSITECEGASSASAVLHPDDAELTDEEAVLRSNDGENGEDTITKRIQELFLPLVSTK